MDMNCQCVVLSSGQWIVVFTSPTATFFEGEVNDEQFRIFTLTEYVEKAVRALRSSSSDHARRQSCLSSLRPSQLRDYVTAETVSAVFYGLHVKYESSGTALFAPRPRILVYPALIIQRDDNTFLTAIDGEEVQSK